MNRCVSPECFRPSRQMAMEEHVTILPSRSLRRLRLTRGCWQQGMAGVNTELDVGAERSKHAFYLSSLIGCSISLRPRRVQGSAGSLANVPHERSRGRERRDVTLVAEIIGVRSRRIILRRWP